MIKYAIADFIVFIIQFAEVYQWKHPQISRSRNYECLKDTHYSDSGNKLTSPLVTKRNANATTPSTARMTDDDSATHSPTAGTKKDTAPATVVIKLSAAVLLLNMDFICLLLFRLDLFS